MNPDERCSIFLSAMDRPLTPFLEKLYEDARQAHIPVIRREMLGFLKVLLRMTGPRRILEVGTAVGFSAIFMAQYAPEPCSITTIEQNEKRIREAERNIKAAGFADSIQLLEGDAAEILKHLSGSYDLIFMDAAKGQYISFLPDIRCLMKSGSVLLTDNVLQEGSILESRFLVERRDRTIHKRMREYLYALKTDPELETSILPLGDGIALCVMR